MHPSSLLYLLVLLSNYSFIYQTLLNSRAAINLIHEDVIQPLYLEMSETLNPLQILMVNGKTLSIVTHQLTLSYTISNVPHEDAFVVALISTYSLILGMLFLEYTDILIK